MNGKERKRKLDFAEIKRTHDDIYKKNFFDVQIHCKFKIYPAHRYVLSCRSEFLAAQLASGVTKLDWGEFEDRTGTALLRWIYTNEVYFCYCTGVSTAEQWLDLLLGSYKLQLVSLFAICESKLLSLVYDDPSRRFYEVSEKVGANQLLEKCLKLGLNVLPSSPDEMDEINTDHYSSDSSKSSDHLEVEIDEINTDHSCSDLSISLEEDFPDEEFEELLQLNKLTFGYHDFRQFSDIEVITLTDKWQAHTHVLESRSKKFLSVCQQTSEGHRKMQFNRLYGNEHKLLRWLYTDCVVFDDKNYVTAGLLEAAKFYDLPTLIERCEKAMVEKVDITSCAYFHNIADEQNAPTVLKRCKQLISQYFNKTKSLDRSEMDVKLEVDNSSSLSEMMVSILHALDTESSPRKMLPIVRNIISNYLLSCLSQYESPTEVAAEGLLTLNDDCLLHIFRFVSLVDLSSIKDTCKRLSSLADQFFRLYGDKSLQIGGFSMFADIWILKHFGKLLKSLSIGSLYERCASRDKILEMIARLTDEKLKSISFDQFDKTEDESFECLKTVLKNVECIEISWLYGSNTNCLLNFCENLKEVNIDGESLKLNSDWCSKNPNITKLTMSGLEDDKILEEVCKKLTRLECLSVDYIETVTNESIHLGRLSLTLKELRFEALNFNFAEMLQQFADKTVLTDLTLSFANMTESLAVVLGDFPNLSKLTFENRADFSENIQDILSKKLVSIESLTFTDCDEITFKVIAKIIKNSFGLKNLNVTACKKIKFIEMGDYLGLRKKRNLQIFLCRQVYERTCKLINHNLLDNVQVKQSE